MRKVVVEVTLSSVVRGEQGSAKSADGMEGRRVFMSVREKKSSLDRDASRP